MSSNIISNFVFGYQVCFLYKLHTLPYQKLRVLLHISLNLSLFYQNEIKKTHKIRQSLRICTKEIESSTATFGQNETKTYYTGLPANCNWFCIISSLLLFEFGIQKTNNTHINHLLFNSDTLFCVFLISCLSETIFLKVS